MATTSKLATTLDLSKIKAKELPTSTVKAVLNPEIGEQEFAIHALSDLDRIDIRDVISNNRSVSRLSKFYVKMLAAAPVSKAVISNRSERNDGSGDYPYYEGNRI